MVTATARSEARLPRLEMPPKKPCLGSTSRPDAWWAQPVVVFVVLTAFVVYSMWAALQGDNYRWGPYLSPLYSPELYGSVHSWLGPKPGWWPAWLLWSPAILILWAPAGLRLTCYYYRGAYYKAFWADPPSCAVGEPRKRYWGENWYPLLLQNVHRYFIYLGLVYLVFLAHDFWEGLWFTNPATGDAAFGVGVGSIVLLIDFILLSGYTFGCHSLRHLVAGRLDQISECPFRSRLYQCGNFFNFRHMKWAWFSLCFVAFTDFYVRMCAMNVFTDWRIF
jgi:hypothetical protein